MLSFSYCFSLSNVILRTLQLQIQLWESLCGSMCGRVNYPELRRSTFSVVLVRSVSATVQNAKSGWHKMTKHMQHVDKQILKAWRSTKHEQTLQCRRHLQSMMPLAASERQHPDSFVFSCSVVEQTCLSECVLFDSNSLFPFPTAMTFTSVWMETYKKEKTNKQKKT